MSDTRSLLVSQFTRDTQALRDALVGVTHSHLSDPTFGERLTLRERLSLIAAHYYRLGEAIAYRTGQQPDSPLPEDMLWRQEAIADRDGWQLVALLEDLEEAWQFYYALLLDIPANDLEWHVQHVVGALSRPAFEASREINTWRLRYQ